MRDQLAKYVELLFAGTTDTSDIQQEILQNSLDRFDDLITQGKSPEAAYRLTIGGIGDINEIIGQQPASPSPAPMPTAPIPTAPTDEPAPLQQEKTEKSRKALHYLAIALYIFSIVPTIFGSNRTLSILNSVLFVAVATVIMVYAGKSSAKAQEDSQSPTSKPRGRRTTKAIIWCCGICVYITLSFLTGGWYITWILFPMLACIQGIFTAIYDLKEVRRK